MNLTRGEEYQESQLQIKSNSKNNAIKCVNLFTFESNIQAMNAKIFDYIIAFSLQLRKSKQGVKYIHAVWIRIFTWFELKRIRIQREKKINTTTVESNVYYSKTWIFLVLPQTKCVGVLFMSCFIQKSPASFFYAIHTLTNFIQFFALGDYNISWH